MKRGKRVSSPRRFRPEELLSFIEMRPFTSLWSRLQLTDDDLALLQITIMGDPHGAPVIPGTGGLRKLRFAPPGWPEGKRGALRVCYAVFGRSKTVALALVYPKGQKDDLTDEEKRRLKRVIEDVRKELER